MKFSVLMSVYINDSYDFFKQAFESIINQTKIPNEIVIVKDGPIKEEINQYLSNIRLNGINLKVINFEKNVGLGVALAKGLNCCENDLVARMDSDDISLNNRFEKQISLFEKDKELAIVGGFIKEFYESIDNVIGVRTVPLNSKQIQKYMRFRSPFNHVSVMFRKTEIIKSGNYQDYKLNEDYYLWVRLMKRHVKACNIKDILVLVRMNSSSYKRKSGWGILLLQMGIHNYMLKNKMTNIFVYTYNFLIRFFVQVIFTNSLRKFFYTHFLRKKFRK